MQQQYQVVGEMGCQLFLKRPELTINVLKRGKELWNEVLETILAYFFFSTGVKAQTEKR
jgi:hypothetical protein